MTEKERINARLRVHRDYILSQGYKENQILGVFLYGSQNYNFATPDSDIDSKVIVLPTLEQLCFNNSFISKEYCFEQEHIVAKDIRAMREEFMKQNINFVEVLFTEYFILNEKYADIFNKYFIENREAIAHYNKQKTLLSLSGQALNGLKKAPTDNKTLYNAKRIYLFLKDYFNEKTYAECLKPNAPELMALKKGESELSKDNHAKTLYAQNIQYDIDELVQKYRNVESPRRQEATTALDTGTMELIKAGINISTISRKDFLNKLTLTETKAYYAIVSKIHDKGTIIISDMVEKTSISRPVYNNLLSKMKENNIAKIINKGVNGTYIEITQIELKNEAVEL